MCGDFAVYPKVTVSLILVVESEGREVKHGLRKEDPWLWPQSNDLRYFFVKKDVIQYTYDSAEESRTRPKNAVHFLVQRKAKSY